MPISWYVVGPTCNTPGHADKFNPSQVWLKLAYCGSGEEDFKTILFQLSIPFAKRLAFHLNKIESPSYRWGKNETQHNQ